MDIELNEIRRKDQLSLQAETLLDRIEYLSYRTLADGAKMADMYATWTSLDRAEFITVYWVIDLNQEDLDPKLFTIGYLYSIY